MCRTIIEESLWNVPDGKSWSAQRDKEGNSFNSVADNLAALGADAAAPPVLKGTTLFSFSIINLIPSISLEH